MTKTVIRALEARDIPELETMVQALAAHHGDAAQTGREALRRDCLGNAAWMPTWVAEADGVLVGYAACQRRVQLHAGRRGFDLHHLYVEAGRRGRGIGAGLVRKVETEARGQGCAWMSVGTEPGNMRAQAFYLGLGFKPLDIDARRFLLPLEA